MELGILLGFIFGVGGQLFMPFLLLLDFKKKIGKGLLYVLGCYIFLFSGGVFAKIIPLWIIPFIVVNMVILMPFLLKAIRKSEPKSGTDSKNGE